LTTSPFDMPSRDAAWVDEGMRVGRSLDDAHLVLVLGDDARSTALAAIGVGRAQSARRRVALGDLLGDAEPIQQLLTEEDPHGLADSFLYGVSINKIARPVPQYGDFYVLPTGSEMPGYADIFKNSRWRRLAAGFRETGSLLVVAAPATAEHLADIVDLTDGIVLVGDAKLPESNPEKLIGRVSPADLTEASASLAPAASTDGEAPSDDQVVTPRRRSRWSAGALVGGALAVALAIIGIWLAARPLVRGYYPASDRRRSSTSSAGTVPSTLDSIPSDSASAAAAKLLSPANPADSGRAAAYSVVVARFNTLLGAQSWLQTQARDLPSPTFAPFRVNGETWYRALAGSYTTRAEADSLLDALGAKGLSRPDSANVVHAPFAFLVDSITADAVPGMLKYFAARGQPVYALKEEDGSARLYAGAFESPAEAALYVDAIRSGGNIKPVLVYRIGRVY
jgi:sporulation related protein